MQKVPTMHVIEWECSFWSLFFVPEERVHEQICKMHACQLLFSYQFLKANCPSESQTSKNPILTFSFAPNFYNLKCFVVIMNGSAFHNNTYSVFQLLSITQWIQKLGWEVLFVHFGWSVGIKFAHSKYRSAKPSAKFSNVHMVYYWLE